MLVLARGKNPETVILQPENQAIARGSRFLRAGHTDFPTTQSSALSERTVLNDSQDAPLGPPDELPRCSPAARAGTRRRFGPTTPRPLAPASCAITLEHAGERHPSLSSALHPSACLCHLHRRVQAGLKAPSRHIERTPFRRRAPPGVLPGAPSRRAERGQPAPERSPPWHRTQPTGAWRRGSSQGQRRAERC